MRRPSHTYTTTVTPDPEPVIGPSTYTLTEAAAKADAHPSSLYREVANHGTILGIPAFRHPYSKRWRVNRKQVDAYCERLGIA